MLYTDMIIWHREFLMFLHFCIHKILFYSRITPLYCTKQEAFPLQGKTELWGVPLCTHAELLYLTVHVTSAESLKLARSLVLRCDCDPYM